VKYSQPLTDEEAKTFFKDGVAEQYSLTANPQLTGPNRLFDEWIADHDRQLLERVRTEAVERIGMEIKLEHKTGVHARTEPSRAYIQGCKAGKELLLEAVTAAAEH